MNKRNFLVSVYKVVFCPLISLISLIFFRKETKIKFNSLIMKKLRIFWLQQKSRFFSNLLRFTGLTTVLFVFQACYGTPQDFGNDVLIEGTVLSADNQTPLQDIEVKLINDSLTSTYKTDLQGKFSIYTNVNTEYKLILTDVDGVSNGSFLPYDTTITDSGLNSYVADIELKINDEAK